MSEHMSWKSVDFEIELDPVEKGTERVDNAITLLENTLEAKTFVLELLASAQAFLGGSGSDALSSVVQAVEDTIQNSGFNPEAQASCYVLDVPLLNPEKRRPSPPNIKSANLTDILLATNVRPPGENVVGAGGNYGIYHAVVESIFDEKDPSRPEFIEGGEMGALVVVYGAHAYLPSLKLSLSLQSLLGDAITTPPEVYGQLPVPQNVKLKPVATPVSARGARSGATIEINTGTLTGLAGVVLDYGDAPDAATVRVQWDKIPSIRRIRGTIYWEYLRQHVYVKEGEPIQEGETLGDYEKISLSVPQISTVSEPGRSGVSVQGVPARAMLAGLDPDKTYYVSVAFTLRVYDEDTEPEGVLFEPTLSLLSEQARVRPKEQVPPKDFTQGTPPDWHAVHSPLFIIPEVRQMMDQTTGMVNVLRDVVLDEADDVGIMLDNASSSIENISERISTLKDTLTRVKTQMDQMNTAASGGAGIWATGFYGKSNRAVFLNKLSSALLGENTENTPPFDTGNEPVGALVFLAEGQSFVEVQKLLGPLLTLFGANDAEDVSGVGTAEGTNASEDTNSGSPLDDLTDDPLVNSAQEVSDAESSLSPKDLGFYDEQDNATEEDPTSLHDIGVDDDPC